MKETNFKIYFNPCTNPITINKILEFHVNHLLSAVLSRLKSQMVPVSEKLLNLVSICNTFLFTTQIMYFHCIWSNQHTTAKPSNPIYIAQDEKTIKTPVTSNAFISCIILKLHLSEQIYNVFIQ